MFLILNIYNLDEIPFEIEIELMDGYELNIETDINFYALFAVVIIILIIIVVLSLSVVGTGLSEFGINTIARYIFYAIILVFFQLSIVYFIYPLGFFGIIINLFIGIIYFLNVLDTIQK
jgi:hypothetical protein